MCIFHKRGKYGLPVYNNAESAFVQTKVCESCKKIKLSKTRYVYGTNSKQLDIIKAQIEGVEYIEE